MKKLILFLGMLLLIASYSWASPDQESPDAHDNETVDVTSTLKIIPQTWHKTQPQLYITLSVNYSQIAGKNLSPAAQHFNQLIRKMVNEEVQKFNNTVKQDTLHLQTLPESMRNNRFTSDYDVDVIHTGKQQLISIRLSFEGMQAGHAHPFHYHRVLNYDLNNKKVLTLRNLFKPHANYLSAIAAYCAKTLTTKLRDTWMVAEGSAPKEKNYTNWNIESDALLITFDEYQVAPYVYGAQEVEIPYTLLKDLLSPSAPIMPCTKSQRCIISRLKQGSQS